MIKFDRVSRQYERTLDCLDYMRSGVTKRLDDCHLLLNRNSVMNLVDIVSGDYTKREPPTGQISPYTRQQISLITLKSVKAEYHGLPPGLNISKAMQSASRIFDRQRERAIIEQ